MVWKKKIALFLIKKMAQKFRIKLESNKAAEEIMRKGPVFEVLILLKNLR